ncbi:hypothetical protein [uncultured Nostoc sp.]|nr:hypothetical protein [uncultured Nostoc sp.]
MTKYNDCHWNYSVKIDTVCLTKNLQRSQRGNGINVILMIGKG